ncbi:hypothetical protein Tco_1040220, partial [Tanacetum coccineum]
GVDESGIDQDGGASPIDADPTVVVLSDADPNGAGLIYAGDAGFSNKDGTVTQDPIEDFQVDDIPTQ